MHQNLFNAVADITGHNLLNTEIHEILDAVKRDERETIKSEFREQNIRTKQLNAEAGAKCPYCGVISKQTSIMYFCDNYYCDCGWFDAPEVKNPINEKP